MIRLLGTGYKTKLSGLIRLCVNASKSMTVHFLAENITFFPGADYVVFRSKVSLLFLCFYACGLRCIISGRNKLFPPGIRQWPSIVKISIGTEVVFDCSRYSRIAKNAANTEKDNGRLSGIFTEPVR